MAIAVWEKKVSESFVIGLDFTGNLPSGVELDSGTASALDSSGASATASILLGTNLTIDSVNNIAKIKLKSGSAKGKFVVKFLVTLDNTDILEEEIIILVG